VNRHSELLAIAIWELRADAGHNAPHMAILQELDRLYDDLGEPPPAVLDHIPPLHRPPDLFLRPELALDGREPAGPPDFAAWAAEQLSWHPNAAITVTVTTQGLPPVAPEDLAEAGDVSGS
jgi:hypothetical protein